MPNIEITSNKEFNASNLAVSPKDCAKLKKAGAALEILNNHETSHERESFEQDR